MKKWKRSGARLRRVLDQSLDFLLPPACAGCQGPLGTGQDRYPVCLNCRIGLRPVPAPICRRCGAPVGGGRAPACLECSHWPSVLKMARALTPFAAPASVLVHALKYQGWQQVGGFMGQEMARRADRLFQDADVIVPIPTSPRRARRRGYNQAQVIAEALAQAFGKPVLHALERPGADRTQTALAPADRRANVQGAFRLRPRAYSCLATQKILLVDDVITTGATLSSAARALEVADPGQIFAYAFAHRIPLEH